MFEPLNLDAMNETDVRETIVRPLLHELGYRQGSNADIKTEVSCKYAKHFLGRKKPHTDPEIRALRGRADYICDVISYGRCVFEVKGPHEPLDAETAHQAHTYAAHPEVAACLYVITNGREFKVFRTSYPDTVVFSWKLEETELHLMTIKNLLSPDAIKRRVHIPFDRGKPLAYSVPASIRIVGGLAHYDEHYCTSPLFSEGMRDLDGMQASIIGDSVGRDLDGQIHGNIRFAAPSSFFDEFNKAIGIDIHEYRTSSEYISSDSAAPTLFQNKITARARQGTPLRVPGRGIISMPFDMSTEAYTQVVGFIETSKFQGTFELEYNMTFSAPTLPLNFPRQVKISTSGHFELHFVPA